MLWISAQTAFSKIQQLCTATEEEWTNTSHNLINKWEHQQKSLFLFYTFIFLLSVYIYNMAIPNKIDVLCKLNEI